MQEEFFVALVFITGFTLIFGLFYLRSRENMALVEKGMNPREFTNRPAPYRNLKWGLLMVGAGIGLFLAYFMSNYVLHMDSDNPVMYFSLLSIFGGLGLITSYWIEKKQTLDKDIS